MNRLLMTTLAAVMGLALVAADHASATAATTGDDAATTETDDGARATTTTVLALGTDNRPPPRRVYPRRPVRRPTYRRRPVYRAPRYVPAPAPRRPVERVYHPKMHFGIGIHGDSVTANDEHIIHSDLSTGGGFSLEFGWRLAPRFSLDLGLWTSFHESDYAPNAKPAAQAALTVDGRFFLTDWNQRLQPYVQVGFGGYVLSHDDLDFGSISGPGFQLGGGVDLYLTKNVSVGGKILYRGAFMDNSDEVYSYYPTEEAYVSNLSYGADLKFHFF